MHQGREKTAPPIHHNAPEKIWESIFFLTENSDKIEELFNVYTVEGMHGCLARKVRNKRLFSRIKFHSFFACVIHAAPIGEDSIVKNCETAATQ